MWVYFFDGIKTDFVLIKKSLSEIDL